MNYISALVRTYHSSARTCVGELFFVNILVFIPCFNVLQCKTNFISELYQANSFPNSSCSFLPLL